MEQTSIEEAPEQIFESIGGMGVDAEEKPFLPSWLARELLALEKKGGRHFDYVPERDQFFSYHRDQGYWKEINVNYLKKICRSLLLAHKDQWDKRYYVSELIAALKDELADPANAGKFNAGENPDLDYLNLLNGMLDWKNDELLDHSPDYYSMFQLPVAYDPDATCPRWMQSLNEWVPEAKTQLFIQEFVGYCLIPDVSRHKAIILFGSGRNGKSTFLDTLARVFGEQNLSHIELSRLTKRFETAHLKDKLVNICADLDPTYIKRTGIIKTIIAGEPLRGEHKFQPSFDFTPVVRLLFSTNELPASRDKSVAWTRRLELIKFPNEFKPGGEKYDRNLKKKLAHEKSGIFNWALEGLKRLERQDRFTGSKALEKAKKAYRYQNDSVLAFLEEEVADRQGNALPKRFLYRKYRQFCKESGLRRITLQKFSRRLREEFGFSSSRTQMPFCKKHGEYKCQQCSPEEFERRRVRCWLDIEVS